MNKLDLVTNNYRKIVIDRIPLIDVRAPVEFEKGAFKTSVNLPLMDNEQRKKVGICYKENGHEAAYKLGCELVSGKIKKDRINAWLSYIDKNPNSIIYCFRGGLRSLISKQWIKQESGIDVKRLEGGYKAFRNYLINSLEPDNFHSTPIVLGGLTGSNKTTILNKFDFSIDLEGLANHRGSSFGGFISPQPTQINFENNLAFELISHENKGYDYMLLEDEGNHIGRSFIPKNIRSFFNRAGLVIVITPIEERTKNICNEYVIDSQKTYFSHYGKEGFVKWQEKIESNIIGIKKRLGGLACKETLEAFKTACNHQLDTKNYKKHLVWIRMLLDNYYDPMYSHQIENTKRKILFKGTYKEVISYFDSHTK